MAPRQSVTSSERTEHSTSIQGWDGERVAALSRRNTMNALDRTDTPVRFAVSRAMDIRLPSAT
jgi:hypothetical protein